MIDDIYTNMAFEPVQKAFLNNDIERMKHWKHIPEIKCNSFVDYSIETGNVDMAKFLINTYNCKPSLYAKQMANINGHKSLVSWTNENSTQRDTPDIKSVYYSAKSGWDNRIPVEYRY
jgi:hypothetical protein